MIKRRIFIIAIGVSLVWHCLWLSAFKIVSPTAKSQVKFSKVAFLGPVLARGAMEVRISPGERSFLENRYLALIQDSAGGDLRSQRGEFSKTGSLSMPNQKMMSMVDDTVSGSKLEPPANI